MNASSVKRLLDELADAYSNQDHGRALGLFTDDITFVGTGQDELRFGRGEVSEQIRRDLTQADSLMVRVTDVHVAETPVPDHVWFYAHVGLQGTVDGALATLPMRMTGVACTAEGAWRFQQVHFSLPAADQSEGESFAAGSNDGSAEVADKYRALLASGDHSNTSDLYTEDAIFDVNVPEWRFQLQGPDAIRHQLDEWHPSAPEIVEWRQRTTERGILFEVALWEGNDNQQYSRNLHDLEIAGGRIRRHTMYCTGDWSKESLAEASAALMDA